MRVLRLAFVLLCSVGAQAQDLETHWRKAKLAESGRTYWWRPTVGTDGPEVSFTMPADAWRKGQLDDGSNYLWRMDPYGQPGSLFDMPPHTYTIHTMYIHTL